MTKILTSLGLDFKRVKACIAHKFSVVAAEDPFTILRLNDQDNVARYGGLFYTIHRADLHAGLRELAISDAGDGSPAELHLSAKVEWYDAETGTVYLENGSSYQADLVIAADGIHSKAASYINGGDLPAKPSFSSVIRFLIPTQAILDDPLTAPLMNLGEGHITYMAPKSNHRFLVRYTFRDNTLQNFAIYVEKPVTTEEKLGFAVPCDRNTLREAMTGFHPAVLRLCDIASEVLPLWRCADRDPVPRCTRGRLVMIGDSFHPMLPYQGRGFVSGAQDAIALQLLFEGTSGSEESEVSKRLELFQSIRLNRVAVTQLFSQVKLSETPDAKRDESLRWLSEDELPRGDASATPLLDWFVKYDVAQDINNKLRARLWSDSRTEAIHLNRVQPTAQR